MRVLIIVPETISYGGAQRFLEQLIEIHTRNHISTALLVPKESNNLTVVKLTTEKNISLHNNVCINSFGIHPFVTPLLDLVFSYKAIYKFSPDLVVIPTVNTGRMTIPLFLPVPALYILHAAPVNRFSLPARVYLQLGLSFNNMIMTVSESAAESINFAIGITRDKIAVVHNSCAMAACRTESSTPIVLTAGHLVAYKNPDVWLEVACTVVLAHPGTRFVWLGDGDMLEGIREKVKVMNLEEQILLPGYVSEPSVWYAQAHIYFQPSLRESHGIAVLEAMASGLPCVVSDAGGLPESVVDGETGYVCPSDDPAGFAGQIMELLTDSALRERMGNAGRQRVERCFSEEEQERKIMALYDRLARKKQYR